MTNTNNAVSILKVSEIFESIQGEGPSIGNTCIFLRLSTCNLKCSWCDTKYTWDWENYDFNKEVKEINVEEIVERINNFPNITNIVITGGEPLLQQDKLVLLLKIIKNKKNIEDINYKSHKIEIETNGTIIPSKDLIKLIDQWNVSPKTSNSLNEKLGINLEKFYSKTLPFFKHIGNAFFKFIVDQPKDIKEIELFIKKYDLPIKRVILMPQSTAKEDLLEKSAWLGKFAKENNYIFSTRLHVLLWDNQRGK